LERAFESTLLHEFFGDGHGHLLCFGNLLADCRTKLLVVLSFGPRWSRSTPCAVVRPSWATISRVSITSAPTWPRKRSLPTPTVSPRAKRHSSGLLEFIEALEHPLARVLARAAMRSLSPSRGRLFHARPDKVLVILLERRGGEPELMYKMADAVVDNVTDAMEALRVGVAKLRGLR
jgi:hypothetical protein